MKKLYIYRILAVAIALFLVLASFGLTLTSKPVEAQGGGDAELVVVFTCRGSGPGYPWTSYCSCKNGAIECQSICLSQCLYGGGTACYYSCTPSSPYP